MKDEARIGKPVRRTDFDDKVEGTAVFTADMDLPGMLHAITLRSSAPRAQIARIDLPALPEGYFYVDHRDIPGSNVMPSPILDQPFLAAGRVNYVGEPIMLIVGPERQVLSDILKDARVHYLEERPVLSIEDAEAATGGFIYADKPYFVSYEYCKGDFERAAEEAAFFIEDEYRTGYQEHAYLETQSMLASFVDGNVTVYGSMQCPYSVKESVQAALRLGPENVRVVQLPTGGGFGGKEDYPSIPAVHAALASMKSGRPVKLVFDRKEDIISTTKRHPCRIRIRSYIGREGTIVARDVDVSTDAGAYAGLSSVVLQRLSFSVCGAYDVENLRVRSRAYATNKCVSGAFRGFGGPQAFFAIEMHTEHIAERLGRNSLALRRSYFLEQGDTSSTGGLLSSPIRLGDIVNALERTSGYSVKRALYSNSAAREKRMEGCPTPLKGIGISMFFHGCGFTGSGEKDTLKAKVKLKKYKDGTVEILASCAEIGQGSQTTLRKIVARALDIPVGMVVHRYPDTGRCPDSGPTVASRSVMIVGRLLMDCALEMKGRWKEEDFEVTRSYTYPEGLCWDNDKFQGNAYPEYSWGGNVVEVEVDPLTFEVKVTGVWGAYDIGEPMDDRIVAGQIDGAVAQGLGYAGMEVLTVEAGRVLQDNLTTYAIPTSVDFPRTVACLIPNPYKEGPFGAKGLGELPLVGVAPAFAAAVGQAIGKRILRLPVTPEYIMRLMEEEAEDGF